MIITIHQPDFLPWLGFFDRWKRSSLYIVLDDVQFLRRGWHHRDKIKTANGIRWLTVPIKKKGRFFQFIKDVEIDNQHDWIRKHLNTIKAAYRRAPNYDSIYQAIEEIYNRRHNRLIELNIDLLRLAASLLGIKTPYVFSSRFNIPKTGSKRLVELVHAVGGDVYLTGMGSKRYLNEKLFGDNGIKICWQEFVHPIYSQLHGDFKGGLSVLDYLMMKNNFLKWCNR